MIQDFLKHLFPRVVLERNLRFTYTFCLGGLAFTAFLMMLASGMLPSLVELATAADSWDALLAVCRERGDEITFAATLAARKHAHQRR